MSDIKKNLAAAMSSVRTSLRSAPVAIALIASAAGMVPTQANASDFEYLGKFIGGEVGRQAGNGYDSASQVGMRVMEVVGGGLGRQGDQFSAQKDQQKQMLEEAKRQAAMDAAADAAYTAERRKIDPTYTPSAADSYSSMQRRASVLTSNRQTGLSASNDQFNALLQKYANQQNQYSQRNR